MCIVFDIVAVVLLDVWLTIRSQKFGQKSLPVLLLGALEDLFN